MVIKFDRDQVLGRLEGLDRWARCAFSVSCVEFLAPAYGRFCALEEKGEPVVVTDLVELVWSELAQPEPNWSSSQVPDPDDLLTLIPDQDEDWNEWSACAENCVTAALLLAQLYTTGEAELAARVAQQAYEAVDWIRSNELDVAVMDTRTADEIVASEIVQSELRRQTQALEVLAHARHGDAAVLAELRNAASEQAIGRE